MTSQQKKDHRQRAEEYETRASQVSDPWMREQLAALAKYWREVPEQDDRKGEGTTSLGRGWRRRTRDRR